MTTSTVGKENPYVGPRSFLKGEKLYGRDLEESQLLDLIIAERIVLLYSPSGAGKSSLVNAAIIPNMEEQGFTVLPTIRVNMEPHAGYRSIPDFNRYVHSVMHSLASLTDTSHDAKKDQKQRTLAKFLDDLFAQKDQEQNNHAGKSVFMVFDQLEEVITQDPTDIEAKHEFFMQVGELLRNRNIWALFVIREDYLATLDPYVRPVPTRLNNRYRLDLLSVEAAIEAIQKPAQEEGGVTFGKEAAEKLVEDLRRVQVQMADGTLDEQPGPFVEPVQLQVVCRRLWENLVGQDKNITLEDVRAAGSTDDALADYYASLVKSVATNSGVEERAIREWVDRKLITATGIRGQVVMEPDVSGGLPNKAIKLLQEGYIVRSEKRGTVRFELAHDRLIKPIQMDNAAWFFKELNTFQRQADLWHSQGRPDGMLLTGTDFQEAQEWAQANEFKLTEVEREFLAACLEAYKAEALARRTNIMIRWLLAFSIIVAIVAVFFYIQANQATESALDSAEAEKKSAERALNAEQLALQKAEEAQNNAAEAQARKLAAEALSKLTFDPEDGVVSALEAVNTFDPPVREAREALRRSLLALRVDQTFDGHTSRVNSAKFSPDGVRVVTASDDGSFRVWNVFSGEEIFPITPVETTGRVSTVGVTYADFSPDGKYIAAVTTNGTLVIYTFEGVEERRIEKAHASEIKAFAFSLDSKRIVTAGQDNFARVWEIIDSGKEPLLLEGHTGGLRHVAFSPDGKFIATAAGDKTARIWNAETGELIHTLANHAGQVNSVAFSPDGKTLATGSEDRTIKQWDVATGIEKMTINGHRDAVHEIAYTLDGTTLISVSADRTVRLWETQYGRPFGIVDVLYGHQKAVLGLGISSRDKNRIVTASEDRQARIWNISLEGSREVFTINNQVVSNDLAISPDGKLLASVGRNNVIQVMDVSQLQDIEHVAEHNSPSLVLDPVSLHESTVQRLAFSPDGKTLVSAATDGSVVVWIVGNWANDDMADDYLRLIENGLPILDVAYDPTDSGKLATISQGGTLKVWDWQGKSVLFPEKEVGLSDNYRLAFTPDGNFLVLGFSNGKIVVLDAQNGNELRSLESRGGNLLTVAISPDGELLASAGGDGNILLREMAPNQFGALRASLSDRGDAIYGLTFSPDGKYLLAGGADGVANIWQMENISGESNEPSAKLFGNVDRILSVAFSSDPDGPDGPESSLLYTTGADQTLRAYYFDFQKVKDLALQRRTPRIIEQECSDPNAPNCLVGPTTEPTPDVTTPETITLPPDWNGVFSASDFIKDEVSQSTAADKQAPAGSDFYPRNKFERPFNADSMDIYYPDIDIQTATLQQTEEWVFISIELVGLGPEGKLEGNYGVEFDLDGSGTGDLLVTSGSPGANWSTAGVRIWKDLNRDVGNGDPVRSNPPQWGDGFETLFFDEGSGETPDLAWVRITPGKENALQFAIKSSVLNDDQIFLWYVWSSYELLKPAWFDYNDYFSEEEAGSPLIDSTYYPLKALFGLDNTCRQAFGFRIDPAKPPTGGCIPPADDQ